MIIYGIYHKSVWVGTNKNTRKKMIKMILPNTLYIDSSCINITKEQRDQLNINITQANQNITSDFLRKLNDPNIFKVYDHFPQCYDKLEKEN